MNKQSYYIYKAASLMKLAASPKYTQEEYDKLINDYKADKLGGLPDVTSEKDMFDARLNERQPEIDNANRRLSKAMWRANGPSPYITGLSGLGGAWLGGHLADWLWQAPKLEKFKKKYKTNPYRAEAEYNAAVEKYKKDKWKRLMYGGALRAGGFLLGGLTPYLASRLFIEAPYDAASAAIRYGYGKAKGVAGSLSKSKGPVSGDPVGGRA